MADALKIIDGPSQWDLMLALFEHKEVFFQLETEWAQKIYRIYVRAISNNRNLSSTVSEIQRYGGLDSDSLLLVGLNASEADSYLGGSGAPSFVYVAYSPSSRKGVFREVTDEDRDPRDPYDPLHVVWGDLIWGKEDPFWR